MKVKHYIEFLPKLVVYILYNISGLFTREKYKWVFGSHTGFADNSKFLIIEAKEYHPEIRAIWISKKIKDISKIRKLGFESYYWLSIKGLYHSLTAGVYVCTQNTIEINRFASKGAVYVNLNHGVGVKECYWLRPKFIKEEWGLTKEEAEKSFMFKILGFPWYFRVPDICLVPSVLQAKTFFAPMFNIPIEHCLYGNYPRNKMLGMQKNQIKVLSQKYESKETIELINKIESFNKTYIYMPTWRNDENDFITSTKIDFERLNNSLTKSNELFIIKLHPFTKINLSLINNYSNILFFNPKIDVYYILPFTDCLITDYSSIYSDYALMNKEVILYIFDFENYIKKCRGLKDYNKYYLGPRAHNFNELISFIENKTDCHIPKAEHDFIMKTYWDNAFNGIDIIEEIKKKLNNQDVK